MGRQKDFNEGETINLRQVYLEVNPKDKYRFKIKSTQKRRKN